jgi:hypothetical protein
MVRIVYPGLVCIALAAFALPAAAQGTPDGITPANEGVCDDLKGGTPGLYGTCVALCEAQDCQVEYDVNAEEVVYNPSCSPASDELFNKYVKTYRKRGRPEESAVPPCVQIACPCWTEQELDNIAGPNASCAPTVAERNDEDTPATWAMLQGRSPDGSGDELAIASFNGCTSIEQGGGEFFRAHQDLPDVVYQGCLQSVIDECNARGR